MFGQVWTEEKLEKFGLPLCQAKCGSGEVNATRSPLAKTVEMSLSKFFNAPIALVELPIGPTLEGCGCAGLLPGMYVCDPVCEKQGADERECVRWANIPRIN